MDKLRMLHLSLAIVGFSLAGCAGQSSAIVNPATSGVVVHPSTPKTTYQSAYLVVKGGKSADMDANLQRELLRRGLVVTIGPDNAPTGDAQLLVRYTDDWRYGNFRMNLASLDVMVFDAHSKALLATGNWKDPRAVMWAYYSADKVVADVVDQIFSKLSK
jgi:hypothetical protein